MRTRFLGSSPVTKCLCFLFSLAWILCASRGARAVAVTPSLQAHTAWNTQYRDAGNGPLAFQETAIGGNAVYSGHRHDRLASPARRE
jgi:hypothetical protein